MGVSTWNAYTEIDCVHYYFTLPSDQLENGMAFWNAAIRAPLMNEQELENEKKVVLSEIQGDTKSDWDFLTPYVEKTLFPDAPYRLDTGGAVSVVKIDHMTEYRYDSDAPKGMYGNFTQADIKCAEMWSFEEKDGRKKWTPRDVMEYRQAHGLTWHEKCDTETMVMVRREINAYFKHVGGCSECRLRDSSVDEGGFDE